MWLKKKKKRPSPDTISVLYLLKVTFTPLFPGPFVPLVGNCSDPGHRLQPPEDQAYVLSKGCVLLGPGKLELSATNKDGLTNGRRPAVSLTAPSLRLIGWWWQQLVLPIITPSSLLEKKLCHNALWDTLGHEGLIWCSLQILEI